MEPRSVEDVNGGRTIWYNPRMPKNVLKSDKYKKARGGPSRLLMLACQACGAGVCAYQKDGTGSLKRLYLDRIGELATTAGKDLRCPACDALLGTKMVYEKEQRLAYRLVPGAIKKTSGRS